MGGEKISPFLAPLFGGWGKDERKSGGAKERRKEQSGGKGNGKRAKRKHPLPIANLLSPALLAQFLSTFSCLRNKARNSGRRLARKNSFRAPIIPRSLKYSPDIHYWAIGEERGNNNRGPYDIATPFVRSLASYLSPTFIHLGGKKRSRNKVGGKIKLALSLVAIFPFIRRADFYSSLRIKSSHIAV